jgi:serine/threonine-protein kinase
VTNNGTFYYVMELLEGFNLDALVERFGPIPAERVISLLTQMCHSLGEAHEEGLIHRDIKPSNVFVCRYGREVDFVKVLDFGMVKSQRHEDPAETQLTGAYSVVGSPASMPRAGARQSAGGPAVRSVQRRLRGVLADHRPAGLRR